MAVKDHHECAYKDADGVIICKSEGKDTECPEYSMGVGGDECWYYRTFLYRIGKGGVPIFSVDWEKHICMNRRVGQRVGFTFMQGREDYQEKCYDYLDNGTCRGTGEPCSPATTRGCWVL